MCWATHILFVHIALLGNIAQMALSSCFSAWRNCWVKSILWILKNGAFLNLEDIVINTDNAR